MTWSYNHQHFCERLGVPLDTDTTSLFIRVACTFPEVRDMLYGRSLRTRAERSDALRDAARIVLPPEEDAA